MKQKDSYFKWRTVFLMAMGLLGLYSLTCHHSHKISVSLERTIGHLKALEALSRRFHESRSVANGHAASVEYVTAQLDQMSDSLIYWTQNVPVFVQVDEKQPVLKFDDLSLKHRLDFTVASGSGSVELENAPVIIVSSCEQSLRKRRGPWVALITNKGFTAACGSCDRIIHAIDLGASAVLTYSTPGSWKGYPHSLQPSPGSCTRDPTRIPSLARAGLISLSDTYAFKLLESMASPPRISLKIESSFKQVLSKNIIAESIHGSNESIILFGSHLDSVPAGPGINDDGSGSMATLELANAFHLSRLSTKTKQKVRFAFWTAEEIGLLGSFHYMNELLEKDPEQVKAHKLNIDTDMIASPNFVRGVWDGSKSGDAILQKKCKAVMNVFTDYFDSLGLPHVPFYFNGRSDFEPFLRNGIPASGVITGEDEIKTPEEAELFGGVSGMVLDPCYHQDCDRVESLRGPGFKVYQENLNALAHALEFFASHPHLDDYLSSQ